MDGVIMEYGLVGEKLSHSFSKYLHEKYLNTNYELVSLNKDEFKEFMLRKDFKGINVTMPYKKEVIKYLDYLDPLVVKTNSCNVVINDNGILKGYNLDYEGFKFLLLENSVNVKDKNIAILGSGGTYNTTKTVLNDLGAKNIYCISRNKTSDTYTYEEIYNLEIDILVNTTPVGMYPNNYESNIDLDRLKNIEVVIDVIFNPLRTKLVVDALMKDIRAIGGLEMLVAQGVKTNELFLNKKYTIEELRSIYFDINVDKYNIVLIGMPMSGKTTLGLMLSEAFNKEFVDIDKEIVIRENMSINEIFESKGEDYFRKVEQELYSEYAKKNSVIISCGGGIIKNIESIDKLRENGMIVFIDRKIEKMVMNNHRPLVKSKEDIESLYIERYDLYLNNCDFKINNNGSKKRAVIYIVEAFYEYLSH